MARAGRYPIPPSQATVMQLCLVIGGVTSGTNHGATLDEMEPWWSEGLVTEWSAETDGLGKLQVISAFVRPRMWESCSLDFCTVQVNRSIYTSTIKSICYYPSVCKSAHSILRRIHQYTSGLVLQHSSQGGGRSGYSSYIPRAEGLPQISEHNARDSIFGSHIITMPLRLPRQVFQRAFSKSSHTRTAIAPQHYTYNAAMASATSTVPKLGRIARWYASPTLWLT